MANEIYTAQEMREESDKLDEFCRVFEKKSRTPVMLRYAAEVVEENAKLRARLEAVEKVVRITEDVLCDGMTPGEAIECENRKGM